MTAAAVRTGGLARGSGFVNAVFALPVHVTYAVLWAAAYEAAAALTVGEAWRPSAGTAVRAATVLAMLLYLRLIDERKDESYDRVHNPDRPLVTGLVTATELRRAGWIVIAVVLAGNVVFAPWSAVVAVAFFGYAALLTPVEQRFPVLRDKPLVNIATVYPVQLLIGVYLWASAGVPGVRAFVVLLTFAAAFLHFEFARKTVRNAEAGSRMYSATPLGPTGGGLVTLGWALLAYAFMPFVLLPLIALVFPVAGAVLFLGGRVAAWPKPLAMLFLIVFYGLIVVAGAVA